MNYFLCYECNGLPFGIVNIQGRVVAYFSDEETAKETLNKLNNEKTLS